MELDFKGFDLSICMRFSGFCIAFPRSRESAPEAVLSLRRAVFPGRRSTLASSPIYKHNRAMDIVCFTVPQWSKHVGLLHGFAGRRGGKSAGPYASLNTSYRVGDDPKIVSQNVCDLKLAVGIHDGRIVTMRQVHGDEIVDVRDQNLKEAGEADGMTTGERNIFLGVLTADCVPILFVAPKHRVI